MQIIELKDLVIDRMTLLKITRLFAYEEGTCLFYSGSRYETATQSFLCLFPYDFIRVYKGFQQRYRVGEEIRTSLSEKNPWDGIKTLLPDLGKGKSSFPEWLGFFGYEMGAFSDKEKHFPYVAASTPEAYFQRCAVVVSVDHRTNMAKISIADQAEYFFDDHRRQWTERFINPRSWYELVSHAKETDLCSEKEVDSGRKIQSFETEESYLSKIKNIQEMIRAGDVYQINLSQCFEFLGKVDPFNLFLKLALNNPAPFSAFLHLRNFSIVSSSPERFLSKQGNILETRPIKGTSPRGETSEKDKINRLSLMASPKERAELLMITDLMRNDLSKVSVVGSVNTPLLFGCEDYTNVFHLYSIIRSQILSNLHPIDTIRACFPGGSISGCPKLSAMEVIAHLEQRPRGIYTGAIGYFAANGDFDFNIAIRTLVVTEERASIQVGGAIVIDSDPLEEYKETIHKGRSIFEALGVQV